MKQLVTDAIILSRTDYGEADRIITLLTPDYGKLRLMAKGVRRIKSKLAGGIELFSVSRITFLTGRGDVGTLISSRLEMHYEQIVNDIDRTMLGYELIKLLNKVTEDQTDADYFQILQLAFDSLNQPAISADLIQVWFTAQLLRLAGQNPNLETDSTGNKLAAEGHYTFDYDNMTFVARPDGVCQAGDIKFLRLLFSTNAPQQLVKITGISALASKQRQLVQFMLQQYIR